MGAEELDWMGMIQQVLLYHFVCGGSLCGDFGNTFSAHFYFFRLYSLLHFAEISVLLMDFRVLRGSLRA